jgi:hypothetical protein
MSRAAPAAAMVPPLPRRGPLPPNRNSDPGVAARAGDGAAPFDLQRLTLLPQPQRGAALESEETAVQPQLQVGPADDPFEREADDVAETVMRAPEDAPPDAEDDEEIVRRACAACEAEDKIQRETVAQAEAETGPPTLAASAHGLTCGGQPLREGVRGFYEHRLGRDLSDVRLHLGAPARALNESISARAFTFGSHVWLGEGNDDAPSHTLSHEIAHVLQQTQPRALRRDADTTKVSPSGVRRRNARWVPHKSPTLTKSQGASHDRVVELVSKRNPDMLAEVPIPNAGRRYNPVKSFGFADFVKATPQAIPGVWAPEIPAAGATPGGATPSGTTPAAATKDDDEPEADPDKPAAEVKLKPSADTVPAPPDHTVTNFDEDDWTPDWLGKLIKAGKMQAGEQARPMQAGRRFDFSGKQHPRVSGGKLVGVGQAPKQMAIGELKPGHNLEQGEKAFTQQLPRYRRGMKEVSDAVNAVDAGHRDGAWSLTLSDLSGTDGGRTGLHIPDGLHPRTKKPAIERELVLKVGTDTLDTDTVVRGHLAFGPHPTNPGVWSYLYVPSKAPSSKKLTAGQRQSIKTLEKKLRDLIAQLKKTPTKVRRAPRRSKAGTRPAAAKAAGGSGPRGAARLVTPPRRSGPVIRRAPKEHKDDFDSAKRAKWEEERKAFATAVRDWKSSDPTAPATIKQQGASREAFLDIADELKSFEVPLMSGQALADVKLLHRIERVADPRFGPLLGILREKFGFIFVRLANVYDSFRDRLAERMKKAPSDAPSGYGGWKQKAIKLLIAAAVTGAKLLARQVVANFAVCIDALANRLLTSFEGELAETFEDEITALTDAFDEVRANIEEKLEPFLALFDALFETLAAVKKIESILSDIITAARIALQAASCVSPPLWGCLWGLVGQVALDELLGVAVDRDWFKETVINPIAQTLINPIADAAYKKILELLLGAPDPKTFRGRLSQLVKDTPDCRTPTRSQMFAWSGAGLSLPSRDPHTPHPDARKLMEQYEEDHADDIKRAVKDAMRNKDGTPATDAQIEALRDAIAKSGLGPEALKKEINKARKGGKVDPEKARQEIEAESGGSDYEIVVTAPRPSGGGGKGDKTGTGVIDLARTDKGFTSGGKPASWYGQLLTPTAKRKPNTEARLTMFFQDKGQTYRFSNLAVTFLEITSQPEVEGGPEITWLRFSVREQFYLKSGKYEVRMEAQEYTIRLPGEPAGEAAK